MVCQIKVLSFGSNELIRWRMCSMINYKNILNLSNDVYGSFQDDLSRDIYMARVMNSLTYDYNYITRITVDNIDVMDKLRKDIESYIREGSLYLMEQVIMEKV